MANLELEHKDLERKFEEARTIWRNSMDRLEKDNKELKAEVQRLKQTIEDMKTPTTYGESVNRALGDKAPTRIV